MENSQIIPIDSAVNIRDYTKYKKYLICFLCKGVSIEPFFCENCVLTYCDRCLQAKKIEDYTCPNNCSNKVQSATQDYNKIFINLVIKCQKCFEMYLYPNISVHKCNKLNGEIYVNCEFCFKEVQKSKYTWHLINSCTGYYVNCSYCKMKIEIFKEKDHEINCEVRLKNTCGICNNYISDNFYEHYYKCSTAKDQEENLSFTKNKLNKVNFSEKSGSFHSKINDEMIKERNINIPFSVNANPVLAEEINNLTLMISLILKGNETSFCKKCRQVRKLNDLICCAVCRKGFCSYCCLGCNKCDQILDKDCYKNCYCCKKVICGACDKNAKNYCLCGEINFCGDSCLSSTNVKHLCRFLNIIPKFQNIFIINTVELNQYKCFIKLVDTKLNYLFFSLVKEGDKELTFNKLLINPMDESLIIIFNKSYVEFKSSKDYTKLTIVFDRILLVFDKGVPNLTKIDELNLIDLPKLDNKREHKGMFLPIDYLFFNQLI